MMLHTRIPTSVRRFAAPAVAITIAVITFGFRFLSFRGMPNDQYMHLAWARQLLSGELPGRDFIEPGMPLAIALSAAAQWIARGPLSEAILSIAMLAVAASVTWVVVRAISRSEVAALGAVLLEVALYPRLYSYPKLLVPAVALLLMIRYARKPSTASVGLLAAWTVVSFLLRHDLGLVAAVATAGGLLFSQPANQPRAVRMSLTYLACGLCMVAPYLIFLYWGGGIAEHVRNGIEFSKGESSLVMLTDLPEFPALAARSLADWNKTDAGALLFWSTNALIVTFGLIVIARWKQEAGHRPVIVSAVIFLMFYRIYILRHSVEARAQDLAAVLAIGLAWTAAAGLREAREHPRQWRAVALYTLASVVVLTTVTGAWTLRDLPSEVRQTEIQRGWRAAMRRAATVVEDGATPPWPRYWPSGAFPDAIGYIDACTPADARLLVTWFAPEYYYFANRRFASGHAFFLPPLAFSGRKDQELTVSRLERQFVPIILTNNRQADRFVAAFPIVASYITRHYQPQAQFVIYDGSTISIHVRKDLTPTSRYGLEGWPCTFVSQAAARSRLKPPGGSGSPSRGPE